MDRFTFSSYSQDKYGRIEDEDGETVEDSPLGFSEDDIRQAQADYARLLKEQAAKNGR